MPTIKIAQFSDLHYCPNHLEEADRCFTAGVTEAISRGVDAVIITGDSTDHALDAHSPATRALAAQLKRLSRVCPVLMLQGTFSHEPPGFLRMISMVNEDYPISVADGISQWALVPNLGFIQLRGTDVESSATMVVSAMPTLNKAAVASLCEGVVDAASEHARGIISGIIRGWADFHLEQRRQGRATVVLSHGTVFNSISEHGVPMAGTDHELGVDTLFGSQANAVMLGHIHKHQQWEEGGRVIAYPGSIGRFHHGEIGEKGWIEWTINTLSSEQDAMEEGTSLDFVPTPSRKNVDIVFDGPPDLDVIKARAVECEGAYVRIQYAVDEEYRHNVDRAAIRLILEKAADLKIEGKILIVTRQRAQGISTVSMGDKLRLWATVTGTPDVDALGERLQLLETTPASEIAEALVAKVTAVA